MFPLVISIIQFYVIQTGVKLKLSCFKDEKSRKHSVKQTQHASAIPWRSWSVQILCRKSLEVTLDLLGWCLWNVWLQIRREEEVSAKPNSLYSPDQEMWPNSDWRGPDALCPPCGLLIPWDVGLGTLSFSCPQSLVQVSQAGREGELAASWSCGYHFPGMETPHSYQPT